LVRSVFTKDADCLPDAPLVYDVLYSLYKSGDLNMKTSFVDGVEQGIYAPLTLFYK